MRRQITLLLLLFIVITATTQPLCNVRTFTVRDGLAANNISGMEQTKDNLMWFSTWNGICCFDGYEFTTFRNDNTGKVLTSNRMLTVRPNSRGDVWSLSYDRNLYLFDTHSCTFVNVGELIRKQFNTNINVRAVYPLANGRSWVVCNGDKENFLINDSLILHGQGIERVVAKDGMLRSNIIKKVLLDDSGREWILTANGASIMGKKFTTEAVYDYVLQFGTSVILASPDGKLGLYKDGWTRDRSISVPEGVTKINQFIKISNNRAVAATDRGLLVYDVRKGTANLVSVISPSQPFAEVKDIFVDKKDRLWVFTQGNGVTIVDTRTWNVRWLDVAEINVLKSTVSQYPFFHEDAFGTVWLIPTGGTFCYYDEFTGQLVPHILQTIGQMSTDLPNVNRYMVDSQSNIWFMGTHNLTLINFGYHKFRYASVVENQEARSVVSTHDGNTWIGMASGEVALADAKGNIVGYLNASGRIQSERVRLSERIYALFEDSRHRLWIGTKGRGLFVRDTSGKMSHYAHSDDKMSLSHDYIYGFDEDSKGRVWVATYGGGPNVASGNGVEGLQFINPLNGMKGYPKDKFMQLRRITHTDDGVILLSTNSGLLTMSQDENISSEVRCYIHTYKDDSSTSLLASDVMQVLVMRSGRKFVVTLGGGVQEIMSKNLLSNTIEFRLIDKLPVNKGVVQSLIEDKDGYLWVVRESNIERYDVDNDNVETFSLGELGQRMKLTEAMPSYSSRTGLLAMGVLGGAIMFHPSEMRMSQYCPKIVFTGAKFQGDDEIHPILNKPLLEVAADRRNLTIYFAALDYSDNYRIRYAYKIEGDDGDWNFVGEAHSASFNHLPSGRLRLLVKSTNADGVWMDNITVLEIDSKPTFWETIWAKILMLLVILAIIGVAVYIYRLRIRNAMDREMSDIKTRFFTEIGHKLRTPLTLIGGPVSEVMRNEKLSEKSNAMLEMVQRNSEQMLTLVNSMLEYSKKRNLFISDENAAGSMQPEPAQNQTDGQPVTATEAIDADTVSEASADKPLVRLLIVEDNTDLRAFLVSILCDEYDIIQAENGRQGLEKAVQNAPDFILTDVMMPEMDGLTMVHNIKQNKDICHIPIIVLSAKASLDDRLQGLKEGVDDYITKPFSATYLKQRMRNIIDGRRLLQKTLLENLDETAPEYKVSMPKIVDADKEMMDRLMAFLNDNIDNPDLKIDDMADAVNLGRTVFYGKLKSIVGMTPVDFLKHKRLQRAEMMIAESNMPVSQIAYMCGFSDPKYFSKQFKKETGMTPSEYRAKAE